MQDSAASNRKCDHGLYYVWELTLEIERVVNFLCGFCTEPVGSRHRRVQYVLDLDARTILSTGIFLNCNNTWTTELEVR
jgi:hypothetical protein